MLVTRATTANTGLPGVANTTFPMSTDTHAAGAEIEVRDGTAPAGTRITSCTGSPNPLTLPQRATGNYQWDFGGGSVIPSLPTVFPRTDPGLGGVWTLSNNTFVSNHIYCYRVRNLFVGVATGGTYPGAWSTWGSFGARSRRRRRHHMNDQPRTTPTRPPAEERAALRARRASCASAPWWTPPSRSPPLRTRRTRTRSVASSCAHPGAAVRPRPGGGPAGRLRRVDERAPPRPPGGVGRLPGHPRLELLAAGGAPRRHRRRAAPGPCRDRRLLALPLERRRPGGLHRRAGRRGLPRAPALVQRRGDGARNRRPAPRGARRLARRGHHRLRGLRRRRQRRSLPPAPLRRDARRPRRRRRRPTPARPGAADGQTIYFGSARSGAWEVWKVGVDGTGLARSPPAPGCRVGSR